MLDAGLKVTINSDDPAYFGGYMNENFSSVGDALGLSAEELTAVARNGFAASFMAAQAKQAALSRVRSGYSLADNVNCRRKRRSRFRCHSRLMASLRVACSST